MNTAQLFITEDMEFSKDKIRPIDNNEIKLNKPVGGLWTSTFLQTDYSWWYQYCTDIGTPYWQNTQHYGHVIQPREDARLLCVTKKEMERLLEHYSISDVLLDYEKLAKDYDGIYYSPQIIKYDMTYQESLSFMINDNPFFYWECESILWLNPAFDVKQSIKIAK